MARIFLTLTLITILHVFVGCHGIDSGASQLVTARARLTDGAEMIVPAEASEVDFVEEVAINRQAYKQGLEALVGYYAKMGNNMKLKWAENELAALNGISKSQFSYIIEANIGGANLKAVTSIAEADYMYNDALKTEKKAGGLIILKNEDMLRMALDKYNQIISKHPSSDKIDDAAYRIGKISEHFRDYSIALLYYQRAYQWDPETIYPARFKAAYILDTRLSRRAEALELYRLFIGEKSGHYSYKDFAKIRIEELSGEGGSK